MQCPLHKSCTVRSWQHRISFSHTQYGLAGLQLWHKAGMIQFIKSNWTIPGLSCLSISRLSLGFDGNDYLPWLRSDRVDCVNIPASWMWGQELNWLPIFWKLSSLPDDDGNIILLCLNELILFIGSGLEVCALMILFSWYWRTTSKCRMACGKRVLGVSTPTVDLFCAICVKCIAPALESA